MPALTPEALQSAINAPQADVLTLFGGAPLAGADVLADTMRAGLAFDGEPLGMWDMAHYLTLLMGEVQRLTDDEFGYGPAGAGFIARVDVPAEVTAAWKRLLEDFPGSVRVANPAFASRPSA